MELEERKKKLIQELQQRYAPQKYKWWDSNRIEYKSTEDIAVAQRSPQPVEELVVIRNIFTGNLIWMVIALGLFIWGILENIVFAVFGFVLCIDSLVRVLDRKNKLIIDIKGIWCHKWRMPVAWEKLVASYIKKKSTVDSVKCFLVVYYYDTFNDDFYEKQYSLQDLEMSNEKIALSIEYFKKEHEKGLLKTNTV